MQTVVLPDAIRWKMTGMASVVIKTSSLLSEFDTYVLSVNNEKKKEIRTQRQLCILVEIDR